MECSYWISTAVASLLLKGSIVELSGRISVQAYIGKDGTAKASLNMHCNTIKLTWWQLIGQSKRRGRRQVRKPVIENIAAITGSMDDMPF